MAVRLLLADDDAALRRVIQFKLEKHGYKVIAVEDGEQALAALGEQEVDIVLTDMKMPRLKRLELLERIKRMRPEVEVILMTAFATVPQAVTAVKLGAYDYLTKPFDDDQLFLVLDKAMRFRQLRSENRQLREQLRDRKETRALVGVSAPFRRMMDVVDKVASSDATVLLTGESGTGKEMVARLIHQKSRRNDHDFVAVNCAAIPRELIESELFGHVRGAFTGAVRDKKGKFELAEGGTLLLDEISELGVELQAKLLRVIQERVIEPIGSEKKIEIDVRLLAATNVNLKERISLGEFRDDLFYRLNVIPLQLPNLHERKEDIPLLTKEFLARFATGTAITLDRQLTDILRNHSWRGNIRELENLIERMVILRESDRLTTADLPEDFSSAEVHAEDPTVPAESRSLTFHEAEKKIVSDALKRFAGNKSRAAAYLKIPRHVLIYRMKKHGIIYTDLDADR